MLIPGGPGGWGGDQGEGEFKDQPRLIKKCENSVSVQPNQNFGKVILYSVPNHRIFCVIQKFCQIRIIRYIPSCNRRFCDCDFLPVMCEIDYWKVLQLHT